MGRVEGKVALITGAASGIGLATAKLLVQEGATVILADISDDKGNVAAKEIGNHAQYRHLDVSQEPEWQQMIAWLEQEYGRLDILVNNAGIMGFSLSKETQDPEHTSLETWHKVHRINLDSVFLGCKHGIGLMKKYGGAIVNVASRSGMVAVPDACAYASSKAAIRNYTKTVALYCAYNHYDIRCNTVCPGAILTPLWDPMIGKEESAREKNIARVQSGIPLQCMGEPIDVAYMILYLVSHESKFVTGAEFVIDGGVLCTSPSLPTPQKD